MFPEPFIMLLSFLEYTGKIGNMVQTYCEKKNILVIKKNFRNSRLKAEN